MLFSRASLVLALTATSFASSLEKRSTAPLSGVLCGIGLLNSCGATVMGINTASDPSNCGSVSFSTFLIYFRSRLDAPEFDPSLHSNTDIIHSHRSDSFVLLMWSTPLELPLA